MLQFDPPQKNLSIEILMLTDLIIESAIRESGEKRSSLEQLICMADMEIQTFCPFICF